MQRVRHEVAERHGADCTALGRPVHVLVHHSPFLREVADAMRFGSILPRQEFELSRIEKNKRGRLHCERVCESKSRVSWGGTFPSGKLYIIDMYFHSFDNTLLGCLGTFIRSKECLSVWTWKVPNVYMSVLRHTCQIMVLAYSMDRNSNAWCLGFPLHSRAQKFRPQTGREIYSFDATRKIHVFSSPTAHLF